MGIRMAAVCDQCLAEPGRRAINGEGALDVAFDRTDETWGDLVAWLREAGWRIDLDAQHQAVRVLCPSHAHAEARQDPPP